MFEAMGLQIVASKSPSVYSKVISGGHRQHGGLISLIFLKESRLKMDIK
jgi:hypothetical protein